MPRPPSGDHQPTDNNDIDAARTRASRLVWEIVDRTALASGADFFPALVRHLATVLDVPYAFVAECADQSNTGVRTLAFWNRDRFMDSIEYGLAGTPCQMAIAGDESFHIEHVRERFPDDRDLEALAAESYLGVPVASASGQILGHLAILDVKPMQEDAVRLLLLRTFAARAGMELERLRTANEIGALNRRLALAADRARTLLAINNAVVLNLTPDALFHAITTALRPVVPFDRMAIFLFDEQRNVLRLAATESTVPSEYFAPGLELELTQSHAGVAFVSQRPSLNLDLARARTYHSEDVLYQQGFRSLAVVPLVVRGRSIGTLNLCSERPMQYNQPEAELLQDVANQVALGIENMRRHEEIGRLMAQLERENEYLREEILSGHDFADIVGASPQLTSVLHTIERVAPTATTVLIVGETGVGKELAARAIHKRSPRHLHPLVTVNCGAISPGMIESELFGHVNGALPGARERRVGRVELADRGTIFLNEVAELPLDTQARLLRVLRDHEFEPVGGNRPIKVDVRVIAATNRNLEEEVRAGRFSAELYYRLNVLPVRVPSLRERRADIPALVMFFVRRHARRIGRSVERVSRDSLTRLTSYQWPGNVRELENVIERALVLSRSSVLDIPADQFPSLPAPPVPAPAWPAAGDDVVVPPEGSGTLENVERSHITATLLQTGWVIEGPRGAARILNMHPNTLRSRMKKLGIERGAATFRRTLGTSPHEMS